MRRFVLAVALLGSLMVVPAAHADITSVFGGDVPCANFDNGTPGNTADDQRRCGRNGTNEVQQVTVTATGGTYSLTFSSQTTSALAFNATPAQIDAALEALSNIGGGGVTVASSGAGTYDVTFTGGLARNDVAEMTANDIDLTGGTASVSTTTEGETPTTTATFDGVPIDVNVALPAAAAGDGPFPLLIWGHGYGGSKIGFSSMKQYTDNGYAVFSMTDRGFHESCGTPGAKARAGAACDDGYVRLMDTRYEVRDAQEFAGILNNEGVADGQRVGALGGSYGGGLSMALAALKDRKMLENSTLVPWTSPAPDNDPMRIAGAVPNIPWTDLSYALVPNGSTLDYVTDGAYSGRFGVMKQSLVNGLYLSGQTSGEGFYAPVGTDPSADLTGWKALLDAGEPYDGNPAATAALEDIRNHHSSYYIDDSVAPAPMLISNGYPDDLFPADEAIRFYNKTRTLHPGTPIGLFFGDFGHQRAANKPDVTSALNARNNAWLDFYVKGTGSAPPAQVESWTQTCPNSGATPSGGPFTAPNWASIAKGEVRIADAAAKTIVAGSGDTSIAQTFDPVNSGGNPCRTASAADQAGVASYRAPAAAGDGYTLTGATTVIADIDSPTANSQLAARLLDVDPSGQERLVSRATLRPAVGSARQVFQLHPNAWQFAPGHVAKVELLPRDASDSALSSYARASNGQGNITVSNVEIRIPVLDKPGESGGAVKVQRDKVVPAGQQLTADAAAIANDANASVPTGTLKASSKVIKVPVASPATWDSCHATLTVKVGKRVLATGGAVVPGGRTGIAKLKLKRKALKRLKGGKTKVTVLLVTAEQDGTVVAERVAKLPKKGKGKRRGKGGKK